MATTVLLVAAAATASTRIMAFPRPGEPVETTPAPAAIRLVRTWCGPETRCRQTAAAFGWATTPDVALRDLEAGSWIGRTAGELMQSDPTAFVSWLRDPSAAAPGGESLIDLVSRVDGWARDAGGDGWPDGRVALVVPPMTVRALMLVLLDWPPAVGQSIDVAPLDVFEVRGTPGRWRLRAGRNLGDAVPSAHE